MFFKERKNSIRIAANKLIDRKFMKKTIHFFGCLFLPINFLIPTGNREKTVRMNPKNNQVSMEDKITLF
jgi:uncharacterized protein YdhG (YjbR/CyaY superfamily)